MSKPSSIEHRLREIERERRRVRKRIREVRSWADSLPASDRVSRDYAYRMAAPAEELPPPVAVGVLEMDSADVPANEVSLEFSPGPEGLDVKRVVMPRLQRTDLLRPAIGGHSPAAARVMEPEHDRFRSYFGTTGLKRVREARRDRGNQRIRAVFMVLMVFTLGFILFKMVT